MTIIKLKVKSRQKNKEDRKLVDRIFPKELTTNEIKNKIVKKWEERRN